MTPSHFARLLMRANQTDKKCGGKCKSCTCFSQITEPTGLDMDYIETDSSPMGSLTIAFFEELEAKKAATGRNFWDTYCELNSSDPECKIFEL